MSCFDESRTSNDVTTSIAELGDKGWQLAF